MVLGVILPTFAATLFEVSLLLFRESPPSLEEALGRVALMFLSTTIFTGLMFALITRHRRDVEHQTRKFDDLFRNAHEGILLVDNHRRITASNPQAKDVLGYPEQPPLLSLCRLCCLPSGESCQGNCPLLERGDGEGPVFRTTLRKSDGALLSAMMCVSRLPNGEGAEETVLRFSELSQLESREQARLARLITRKMLEAREEERRRLARDLHDGIGQELYALRLAAQTGQPVDQMATRLMEDVDNLAKQLWPPVLDKLGLPKALEAAFRPHRNVTVKAEGALPDLSVPVKASLYRIAQEAVTNSLKHAAAESIEVSLEQRETEIFLLVKDNGCGFEQEISENDSSLGLASMRERAELADGVLTLRSQPGRGTTVEVCLPLLKEVRHRS